MEEYSYALKNFTWDGEFQVDDIRLVHNRLSCHADTFEEAETSVNLFLDLIAFYREKDVFFQSAHHGYVEQANVLRTYTTSVVEERACTFSELSRFLTEAYPRYRRPDFRGRSGVQWSLRFFLAAQGVIFFQAKFLVMFTALEILLAHVNPPVGEGPLAGLIEAVRQLQSIPSGSREVAAQRLSAPSLAERMVEFVRYTGIKGVAFQSGGNEENRYRVDEILRIRDDFIREGDTNRFVRGEGESSLHLYLRQLHDLVRESLLIYLMHL